MKILYKGIFIPNHRIIDTKSKEKAAKNLSGWESDELTAESWIAKLDAGQIIQPSEFKPKVDGTFTHAPQFWKSTHFICADGDNIRGVEFLNDGSDKNPDGIKSWTEAGQLSLKFPEMLNKVYAVGEPISSMLTEPLHRRFRIIFLFDKPITSEKHYHAILFKLAEEFPIIPKISKCPAQPIFGNGRKDFNFHICRNILNLDEFPTPKEDPAPSEKPPEPKEKISSERIVGIINQVGCKIANDLKLTHDKAIEQWVDLLKWILPHIPDDDQNLKAQVQTTIDNPSIWDFTEKPKQATITKGKAFHYSAK